MLILFKCLHVRPRIRCELARSERAKLSVYMHIALLSLTFKLPACESLKEKRGRLRGMKDRFGKLSNLAVSETNFHDLHDRAEWSFLTLGQDRGQIDSIFSSIELYASTELDAVVTGAHREWL